MKLRSSDWRQIGTATLLLVTLICILALRRGCGEAVGRLFEAFDQQPTVADGGEGGPGRAKSP
jgi:hypothetical protein